MRSRQSASHREVRIPPCSRKPGSIFAIFLAFFPVVLATSTGLGSADKNVIRLCRSFTASPWLNL
jgi:ABC-type nitrate/sulfonate/bicarbonate transport system permease component